MNLETTFKKFGLLSLIVICTQLSFAAPDSFTLHDATGTKTFKLSDTKGKFVALHFLLKTECPFCLRHTRDFSKKSVGDARVIHVFIKPDSNEDIKQWASKIGGDAAPTIYRDPDAQLAKAYEIPDGYKFHGQIVYYPALVLLNGDGKEVFRYIGKNNTDRLSYEKFSEKLQELTKAATP
jgi:peroxiredoxin Q/BCP